MTKHWELIHHHFGLVFAVDALVADQSSSSSHVRSHPVTYNLIVRW